MIQILLVDDHALIRTGIRSILESAEDMEIVGEAATGEEAVEAAKQLRPDIVIMDVNMPGIGGIEATRRIVLQNPNVHVVALTVLSDQPFPHQLLEAGARGYLSKGCAAEEMFQAVRTVANGKPYLSNEVARNVSLAGMQDTGSSALGSLSRREFVVMMMVTQGYGNQEISTILHLSPKTVSTYRYRIFEKLGVSNDVELTHYALRHGILQTEKT